MKEIKCQLEINKTITKFKTSGTVKEQAKAQKKLYRLVNSYARLINEMIEPDGGSIQYVSKLKK